MKDRQAWCCLQVKLCDPCLSAFCVPWCKKALYMYKYSSFPFLSFPRREIKVKKVKASHTRYQALGPELIPVYRQSASR